VVALTKFLVFHISYILL